ncbi:MAG: aminotransferase class V-fold PLP-dependent enzyme [Thermomicrobiales bacterium]
MVVDPSTPAATTTDPKDWMAELGVRPVINAAATLTKLGGSVMPPEVVAAMQQGAKSFIDLVDLQRAVSAKIAAATKNEAAYVSSGAAAGITLTMAAILTEGLPERIQGFPALEGFPRTEIIIHRSQRNGYDYAARMTGATFVEIEDSVASLEAAFGPRTAAVLWFAGGHLGPDAVPIETVVEVAHARGVPVVVDAAAQIPSVRNLWRFTREIGADICIVSGGKGLRGPQSSGLVLGRKAIIDNIYPNASPNSAIGRPMKVGKEELVGLLAAVEWTLAQDEDAIIEGYERIVQYWLSGLAEIPGISAERGYPNEAGQPFGRVLITLGPDAKLGQGELVTALWEGTPRIAVSEVAPNVIGINPQTLGPGEEVPVIEALRDLLS